MDSFITIHTQKNDHFYDSHIIHHANINLHNTINGFKGEKNCAKPTEFI